MPQYSDDLFLGPAPTYIGTGIRPYTTTATGGTGGSSSTTLTITALNQGAPIVAGMYVDGTSVTDGTYITEFGTGTGGTGTYVLNQAINIANTTALSLNGNIVFDNPSPMSTGVGPLGRVYIWDVAPQALVANNIAASQTPTASGSLTLTAGTSIKSVTTIAGVAALQTDIPRAVRVTTGAAAAVLTGVAITGTAGQFSCTATTNLVVGQYLTISGTLGGTGTITGYTNPTTYKISATNGTSTFTLTTTADVAIVTTAGTPTGLTYTRAFAAQTVTVSGFDYYGQAMSEAITSSTSASTGVSGKKAFFVITGVTTSGSFGGPVTVGTTDILGLPVRAFNAGYIVHTGWDNVITDDAGTFVAADTATATTTTGDVRGTYVPSSATNGIKRLVVTIALPAIAVGPNATRIGALGVTQA